MSPQVPIIVAGGLTLGNIRFQGQLKGLTHLNIKIFFTHLCDTQTIYFPFNSVYIGEISLPQSELVIGGDSDQIYQRGNPTMRPPQETTIRKVFGILLWMSIPGQASLIARPVPSSGIVVQEAPGLILTDKRITMHLAKVSRETHRQLPTVLRLISRGYQQP